MIFSYILAFSPSTSLAVTEALVKDSAQPILKAATKLDHPRLLNAFSLTDTHENTFTQISLFNHWTLVFFGYSTCFNICPKTLTTISKAWKLLPPTLTENSLRFVFITLDPKTDVPLKLKVFLEKFNPEFIGLTGNPEVIQTLSKKSGVFSYEDPNHSKAGVKVIDHSGSLLLINPKGQIQAVFSPPHDPKTIAEDLQTLIKQ